MRKTLGVLTLLAILATSGCVSFTSPIRTDRPIAVSDAVVYGRFNRLPSWRFDYLQIGLVLADPRTQKDYVIRFERVADELVGFALPPSEYTVSKVIFVTGEGVIQKELPVTNLMSSCSFKVAAGHAYYIGDFQGRTTIDPSPVQIPGYFLCVYGWQLTGATNNYAATTTDIIRKYPALGNRERHDSARELNVGNR